ncbi:MAG: KOW domain-containing RNA-binding protein [Ruminococcus sp.]|nr:KOW domain-containing RNA-binding protein [Ruminococcus sp.]
MDFFVGQIVKAKAGRDKDGFFVVLSLDGAYAYIADGKSRKVQNPKKKKLIHLAPTKSAAQTFTTNREIKMALTEFRGGDDE